MPLKAFNEEINHHPTTKTVLFDVDNVLKFIKHLI